MSMSAQQVLLNCKKHFELIKKDLKLLLSYIKEEIEKCKMIDASNFHQEEINKLYKEVEKKLSDMSIADEMAKEVQKDEHIAIEQYNKINNYLERKRETIADLKTKVFIYKKDIVNTEQKFISNALINKSYASFQELVQGIIQSQVSTDDKILVKKFLIDNEVRLINLPKNDVIEEAKNYIFNQKQKTEHIINDVVKSSIEYIKDEEGMEDYLKDEVSTFKEVTNEQNLFRNVKSYFMNASKSTESELVRRDNVIKIVNAIRSIGYVVNPENIINKKEKNVIFIHGEKPSGETADFAVRLDGSFIYNYEGFENHDHDEDANDFMKKLKEFGLSSSEAYKKVYREPKYVADVKKLHKKKYNSSK